MLSYFKMLEHNFICIFEELARFDVLEIYYRAVCGQYAAYVINNVTHTNFKIFLVENWILCRTDQETFKNKNKRAQDCIYRNIQ